MAEMTTIFEAVLTTLSGIFFLIVIPLILGLMLYSTYWASKRHSIMMKVFDAFKEMGSSGCVPVDIVLKCAREISELTSSSKNKLVAVRAKSTLVYIEDQVRYYREKKAASAK